MGFENSKFVEKFTEFSAKLGNQIHLRSLRDAFATVMPLYILAGLAVLFNNTVFKWILSGDTLTQFQYWGTVLVNGTLNISGILIACMASYYLASNRNFKNPISAALVAIASLVIMMPNSITLDTVADGSAVEVAGALSFNNLGTSGMFAGVIIGLISTEIFVRLMNVKALQINLGENVPPAVGKSFSVLIPVVLVLSGFGIASALLYNLTGTNFIDIITSCIQEPLRHIGTGLWGCVILYSLGNMLWLFGIHQSVIYSSILEPLLIINITENIAAMNAGQAIPNIINVSQVTTFGLIGGSGSTLCLILATLIAGKSKATRNVAKLAVGPGIFNINEPVIFGYPIVYNISMAIPFVLVPALGIIISYFATSVGLIAPCVSLVPWTTPALFSAFVATAGDWRAVALQAAIIILGTLIYIPFVRINDKVLEKGSAE